MRRRVPLVWRVHVRIISPPLTLARQLCHSVATVRRFRAALLPPPPTAGFNAPLQLPAYTPFQPEGRIDPPAGGGVGALMAGPSFRPKTLEKFLHQYTRETLRQEYGEHWWRKGIPVTIRAECAAALQRDPEPAAEPCC